MNDDPGQDGEFLRRWSRRKRGLDATERPAVSESRNEPDNAAAPAGPDSDALPPPLSEADIDGLDFQSDFKRWMTQGVPDELRSRALQKLWTSSPVISTPDELDDYLEDFSEAAMAVPTKLLRSAYEVGRGVLNSDEIAAREFATRSAADEMRETETSPPAEDDVCATEHSGEADTPASSDAAPSEPESKP